MYSLNTCNTFLGYWIGKYTENKCLVSENTWEIPKGTFEAAYIVGCENNIKMARFKIEIGLLTCKISNLIKFSKFY